MQRLQQGSQGQDVQRWQAFLIAQGLLAAGEADGIFGPKTKAATSSFQGKHGLEADGIVGPNTLARANALGFEGKLEPSQSQGLGASSRERLAKVHPQLAQRITKLAAIVAQRAPHITPVVTSGVRTFAEQDELFAQARAITTTACRSIWRRSKMAISSFTTTSLSSSARSARSLAWSGAAALPASWTGRTSS
jgi:hypothetical protein